MGITTPLSTNPAMTIGGLTVGVTPLDMAHAYETIAHGGERVSGSMAARRRSPSASRKSTPAAHTLPDGAPPRRQPRRDRAASCRRAVAADRDPMLETVLQYGTGKAAAIGQFAAGKTGTTSNYGDAWFVGWDSKYTVAVWVGYPDKLVPMTDRLQRQPRARRHLPGADLARLHDLGAADRQEPAPKRPPAKGARPPARAAANGRSRRSAAGPSSTGTSGGGSHARLRRRVEELRRPAPAATKAARRPRRRRTSAARRARQGSAGQRSAQHAGRADARGTAPRPRPRRRRPAAVSAERA